jgi:raffinose/stachyose/melibiose transport system permease protein
LEKRYYTPLVIVPALALYGIFFLMPVVISFYFAFTDWNVYLTEINFIGLENFGTIFQNPIMVLAMKNTLLFAVVTTIGKNVAGLSLALLVSAQAKIRNIFRSMFFAPAILSYIVIGLLFTAILHPSGLLNNVLSTFGLGFLARHWIANTKIVMYSVSFVEIWQWSGFHMAIYIAGLQSIPQELKEASLVDGATGSKRLFRVTLPLIMPSFSVNIIIALISGFKVFDLVFILTNGGPGFASEVVSTQIYTIMGQGRWGEATAMNLILLATVALFALTLLSYLRKKEVEY